ncbi:sugar kinase [Algoriphagus boritolerans]|uniref:2-dehydro-3-deoxygluconokinase n=1 Tax=Algoriphagus boritolerans DSM 17298 = JCM 18970 TaxID=1120964 RepID=A0A1H5TV10_9BACT|nr:sugar kinase [Algoriphagus boritolerans]SEF66600.1 2-dehydro-3-deoxygluconokinase [Algoriphagus boritolerans DSM 17298 = JCM 18970]
MKKIVTIGEVMLRLSPPGNQRFFQTHSFDVEFGGSEANVGAALAFWGLHVSHLTAFPDNEIGWAASGQLRKNGIDTRFIPYLPGRMGVYYLEQGAMQRSSQVIYDRINSAFSNFDGKAYNWDEIFHGVSWFHWSGITPALSAKCAELTLCSLQEARKRGITVSGDLNYRSNLWRFGKEPHEVMPELMALTNVMIAGSRDFKQCLNEEFKSFTEVRNMAFDRFPHLEYIVKTDRISHSSSNNTISAMLFAKKRIHSSKSYELTHIVDRVGTGDAFAGGLIYGLLHFKPKEAIEFAMAAGAIKHSVPGDVLLCSLQEIQELASGEAVGKIKR